MKSIQWEHCLTAENLPGLPSGYKLYVTGERPLKVLRFIRDSNLNYSGLQITLLFDEKSRRYIDAIHVTYADLAWELSASAPSDIDGHDFAVFEGDTEILRLSSIIEAERKEAKEQQQFIESLEEAERRYQQALDRQQQRYQDLCESEPRSQLPWGLQWYLRYYYLGIQPEDPPWL